jgi:predicted permease
LGVNALLGRTITPEDDRSGAAAAIVLSYSVWQASFGGDPSVLSRTLQLGATQVPIVGVLPPNFYGLDPAFRFSVVMAMQSALARAVPPVLSDPHNWNGCQVVFGIVRPGVSEIQAQTESEALVRQAILADPPHEYWEAPHMLITRLDRGIDTLRKAALIPFRLLMAASGLILLVACANVAGLLLARGIARQKEIATQLALGASLGRLVQQLLTESLVLASIGGTAGFFLAYLASPLIPRLFQQFNYYVFNDIGIQFRPDFRVLILSVSLVVVTGLLCGVMPAFRGMNTSVMSAMKVSATTPERSAFRSGRVILAAQVALSMILLAGAGLFLRTLLNLHSIPMGYDPSGILYFTVDTRPNREAFIAGLLDRLRALPGATSVTASIGPLFTSAPDTYVQVCTPGVEAKNFDDRFADSDLIFPRFFETWRVPILRGRDFRADETPGSIIVNQAFVQRYLAGSDDPLGQTIAIGANCSPSTVIGVVANSTDRPRITPRPFVYKPYSNQPTQMTFAVRTSGNPNALRSAVRAIVAQLQTRIFDPVTTGDEYRGRTMLQERLYAALISAFAVLALLIAAVGIYGITICMVRRRTREIGIRMSLGAQPAQVLRLITAEALTPVAAGVVAGTIVAIGLAKLVESVLFGVTSRDPWSLASAAILLLVASVIAAVLPARIATRVDPIQALRQD